MPDLLPSPNPSRPPPFHELDDEAFEELCCALLDQEPGIRTADRYGAPRQKQFGIDVLGQRVDEGVEVVSCKCCSGIRRGEIPAWCDDFLRYWDGHWKTQGVRRFVLAVAADVRSHQRQSEIKQQKAKFAAHGIEFEVWGPRQLQAKLRPYHAIAAQYLTAAIADHICGTPPPTVTQHSPGAVIASQLSKVQATLAAEIDHRLDIALSDFKRGDEASLDRAIREIQGDPVRWDALSHIEQARVVRLRASRELEQGNIECAEQLADEADRLAGIAKGRRLRAAIAAQRGNVELGLGILGEPDSADDRRLRSNLLVLKGDFFEALDALPAAGDAEDDALRALILAAMGRPEEALTAVKRSEQLEPDLLVVRHAGIRVRYAAALSPAAPFDSGPWPNPLPLGLVRDDDVAHQRLQEAGNIANAALQQRHPGRESLHNLQTWRLACLANQRTRSLEAEAYAGELLAGGKPHPGAVAWSLTRGFDFDRSRIARSLANLLESGRANPSHLMVLLALELDQDHVERARRALARYRSRFASIAGDLLSDWEAIVSARNGKPVPPEAPPALQLQNLIEDAKNLDSWEAVKAFVEKAADRWPPLAYQGLDALASAHKWNQVVPFIPFLVQSVATADAVALACFAAYGTDDAARAIALLDEHSDVFPNATPPLQLRRLRVSCLQRLGRLPEAARLADSLVGIGGLSDLLAAIDVRLTAGDIRGAMPYFRMAAEREDLPPEVALQYARIAKDSDPIIALDLWRKAQSLGLPQQLAALAATTAFALGLDLEAGTTLAGFTGEADGSHGPFRKVSGDELIDLLRKRQDHVRQIEAAYLSGAIPIHVAVDEAGGVLAENFARAFAGSGGPLLIRHGSRGILTTYDLPATEWRLRLDVTAILIAYDLDLLDVLEHRLAPLQVPLVLPSVLREMASNLRPIQPSRIQALRRLASAVDDGHIAVAALGSQTDCACAVVDCGGILVDYTPSPPNETENKHLANLRRITDALSILGGLSDELIERGRSALGYLAEEPALGPEPQPGQTLGFLSNTLENIATAGLLDALTATFKVVADVEWVHIAQDELDEVDRREKIALEVDRLCDRIAHGIERGIYEVLPASLASSRYAEEKERLGPAASCLVGLFSSPLQPNQVLWVDDRHLTRFQRVDDIPLLGVVEVLSALRADDLLPDDAYYDRLQRLRAAGAQFLPLIADEVVYHLDRAPLQDHALVETAALRTLRRSSAASALLEDHLHLIPLTERRDDQIDELPVLHNLWRLSADVIEALWRRDDCDNDRVRACADWVVHNLMVDRLSRVPLDGAETSRLHPHALALAKLIASAIQITGTDEADEKRRRRAYYRWLDERVLEPRLNADPELVMKLSGALQDLILGMLVDKGQRIEDKKAKNVARVLIARLLAALPERVGVPLLKNTTLLAELGLEPQSTVDLDGVSFTPPEFFAAVAHALTSGAATVPAENGAVLHLERTTRDPAAVHFSGAATGDLVDPALGLLDSDPVARHACLATHPEWIDRPKTVAEQLRSRIVAVPEPHGRMLAIDEERRANADLHYRRLVKAVASQGDVEAALFEPPPADVLVRYLRLDADCEANASFTDLSECGAQTLVADGGPGLALGRLSGLPVYTPAAICQSLTRLEARDRERMLDAFDRGAASPLRRARAISLLRASGVEQARLIASVDRLLTDIEDRCEAFLTVLAWSERVYERAQQWRSLSRPLRLATLWTHADRVVDILLAHGAPAKQIVSVFRSWHPRALPSWLIRDPMDAAELADPMGVSREASIYRFVGLALGDQAPLLLTAENRSYLEGRLCDPAGDGARVPKLGLFAPAPGPDALESFLADEFLELADALGECRVRDVLSPSFTSDLADHAITLLSENADDIGAWITLVGTRQRRTSPEEHDRIVDLLCRLDLTAVAAADAQTGRTVAVWSAGISRFLRNTDVDRAVEEQILAFALVPTGPNSSAATEHGVTDREFDHAVVVGDAALRLSQTPAAGEVADKLARLVPRLVAGLPALAPVWREALEQIVDQLPYQAVAPLWPVLQQLRARSDV